MRKDSLLTLTALAFVLTLGSCSKDDDAGTDNDGIIRFGVSEFPESRAAINSAADFKNGDAFDVWGYYTSTTAGKIDVFKGENGMGIPVTKSDAGWGYGGGDRYWVKEMPYTFYAVYPSQIGKLAEDGSTITVDNFDCSAIGTGTIDLMTAKTNISYSTEQTPQPVALQFSHELSRLKFTVKSENTVDTIKSFKVYGVNYQGTLTKKGENATWNPVVATTAENTPFRLATSFTFNTTNGWEKDMLGDVLLIPDTDLTDAKLEIVHRYQGEKADRTSVVDLNTGKTSQWEAGKSYHYSLTIKGGNLNISVTVNPWDEKNTSVSWE